MILVHLLPARFSLGYLPEFSVLSGRICSGSGVEPVMRALSRSMMNLL